MAANTTTSDHSLRPRSAGPSKTSTLRDRPARPAVAGRRRRPASATPSSWPPPTPPPASGRASTSSRSPSTSRSGCTPPGKIPGSFFRREGRPVRHGHPDRPAHRPPPAAQLRRRLPQRDPGRRSPSSAPTRRTRTTCWRSTPPAPPSCCRASRSKGRSGRCASPTPARASGVPIPPTRRATPPPSSWSSPVASSTTATSPS